MLDINAGGIGLAIVGAVGGLLTGGLLGAWTGV